MTKHGCVKPQGEKLPTAHTKNLQSGYFAFRTRDGVTMRGWPGDADKAQTSYEVGDAPL